MNNVKGGKVLMKFRGREELDVAELKVAFKTDHR